MDEERVKEIRFKASSYSWKHGGSDLVRFIFELLDERILLREEKSHLNDLYEAQTLRRTEAEVKNEKLREKMKLGAEIIEAKDKHRAELEDDNERLRVANGVLSQHLSKANDENERLRREEA
jgi:predicted nuclease with TOPRIM domain